jgi:mannobiose 2-epimerase
MEAVTTLYEAGGDRAHREELLDVISLLDGRIMHSETGTGVPQFHADWSVAPQIKFDIVWGWDRFTGDGAKRQSEDNTSYGHNLEYLWLARHALAILGEDPPRLRARLKQAADHAVTHGLDREHGGVFVEGAHQGGVHDREKEFWQQAEAMVGFLEAALMVGAGPEAMRYLDAYENVHRFVHDLMIHRPVGEWWPLMTREGVPVWRHMAHSWKINYHTVRAMIQSILRLEKLAGRDMAGAEVPGHDA